MPDSFHEEMQELLRKMLEKETKKIICQSCGGRGSYKIYLVSVMQCPTCNGEGRILPNEDSPE